MLKKLSIYLTHLTYIHIIKKLNIYQLLQKYEYFSYNFHNFEIAVTNEIDKSY